MPSKKAGRRLPPYDWGWAGTEVTDPQGITEQHLRRAAGWDSGGFCKFRAGGKQSSEDDKGEKKTKKTIAEPQCGEKKCEGWPRCYNHLGVEELFEPDAKEDWIKKKLGEGPEPRRGAVGLKNLGATCYANAFLQLWYHNVAFRNGLYSCLLREGSGLYNLSLVFAQLQHTEQSIVDPTGLIDALKLNRADQQDAAEFSSLFLSLIAAELDKQPESQVRGLIKDLFQGRVTNVTECGHCRYKSRREETFLELALALKNNITLEQCFESLLAVEELVGANRYLCPQCSSLQNATRFQELSYLPPYLNLALMRFVYNPKKGDREKSKCVIKYPPEFKLGGQQYRLKAVITHLGTSAHHGHFVCDTVDSRDGEWYHFNDEEVVKHRAKEAGPAKKKMRIDSPPSDPVSASNTKPQDGIRSSKDAYMLVYMREEAPPPAAPPPLVMARVDMSNALFAEQLEGRKKRRSELEAEWDRMYEIKAAFLRILSGSEHLVPRSELKRWLSSDLADKAEKWDMSSVMCEHGAADPLKTEFGRLISTDAIEMLRGYGQDVPNLNVCRTCVERGFDQRSISDQHRKLVAEFDEHNAEQSTERFLLPKQWVDAWRKGILPAGVPPSDAEHTLFCEHGSLRPRAKTVAISHLAYALLQSDLGEFPAPLEHAPVCEQCIDAMDGTWAEEERWARDTKMDKAIKKHLDPSPRVFGQDYYIVPRKFFESWKRYLAAPGERPKLKAERCEHGCLDLDPMVDEVHTVTQAGWALLVQKYGPVEPAILQYQSERKSGLGTEVGLVEPAVCQSCRRRRLLDFTTATIHISLERENVNQSNGDFPLTKLRSRAKSIAVEVRKSTTIKEIKVEILQQTEISPINQRLTYRSRELQSDDTIAGLGVLSGDTIRCVLVEEDGDLKDVNMTAEGFGGTMLVGAISCPVCTLINPADSLSCEACDQPFAF